MIMKKPEWLPNWKRPQEYPDIDPKKASRQLWAWQFLRRNSKYQEDYAKFLDEQKIKNSNQRDRLVAVDKKYVPAEVACNFLEEEGKVVALVTENTEKHFLGEYRVNTGWLPALDPSICYPPEPIFDPNMGMICVTPGHSGTTYSCGAQGQDLRSGVASFSLGCDERYDAVAKFDLRIPIKHQIKGLKKFLEDRQVELISEEVIEKNWKTTRNKEEVLLRYLRFLDAKASGVTKRKIAKIIFPELPNSFSRDKGQQDVVNGLLAAEKYRDHTFHLLRPALSRYHLDLRYFNVL